MNEQIIDFIPFCKNQILDNIENYEGQSVYGCDLGYTLTEGMNADGTFTYSTELAKDYIREWWWEAGEYSDYEKFSFGERQSNPFENPEAYIVRMVVEGVNGLLAKLPIIDKNWNDKISLNKRNIDTIQRQLEELDDYDTKVF